MRALVLLWVLAGLTGTAVAQRPNILVIFSDDHAYQAISAYGSPFMHTPNIDRIAAGGAIFTNAFVTNSLCSPSRATLLTGKYSHINGRTVNGGKPFDVHQEVFTRLLGAVGYQTAWIGKWHLQTLPGDALGYSKILVDQGHYYNPDFISGNGDTARIHGYVTDIISDLTFDWLDHRDTSRPFCLIVGEKAPHREWLPDIRDLGAFDSVTFPVPPNFDDQYFGRVAASQQDMTVEHTMLLANDLKIHPERSSYNEYTRLDSAQRAGFFGYYAGVTREYERGGFDLTAWKYQRYMRDYLATTLSLDRNIGRLLDYLDSTGLARNTIVIYASDQGFYLGEHGWFDKRWIYEESMRTPLLMRYPGVIAPGTRVSSLVANIDFAPTLLSVAGVRPPADMQGQTLLPLASFHRDAVYYHYYEYPQPHHVSPHFGVRTSRYKLVRFYGPADNWELYDLASDPHEMHNLYGLPAYAGVTASLRKRLQELIRQYKDVDAGKILDQSSLR